MVIMTEEQTKIQLSTTLPVEVAELVSERTSPSIIRVIWHRLCQHSGIWYMMAGNIIFVCCTFVLKFIPADMFDIMIMRFLVQSVVFGSYAQCYKHYSIFDTNGQPLACILNMIMSSGTNLTYLAAFYFLPLSDINAFKYTYIVWAAIMSVIFFKDQFKCINALALTLTIAGLILASNPQFLLKIFDFLWQSTAMSTTVPLSANSTIDIDSPASHSSKFYYVGILLAFTSSLTKAIQMISRKQLVKTKQPYSVMNFQFTAFALVVALIYSICRRFWQTDPYNWKLMFTVGIFIGCCHLVTNTFYAKALKRENVQLLAILSTLDIVYACILQYIFLRLTRPWMFYLGASFIVISALLLSIDSYKRSKT